MSETAKCSIFSGIFQVLTQFGLKKLIICPEIIGFVTTEGAGELVIKLVHENMTRQFDDARNIEMIKHGRIYIRGILSQGIMPIMVTLQHDFKATFLSGHSSDSMENSFNAFISITYLMLPAITGRIVEPMLDLRRLVGLLSSLVGDTSILLLLLLAEPSLREPCIAAKSTPALFPCPALGLSAVAFCKKPGLPFLDDHEEYGSVSGVIYKVLLVEPGVRVLQFSLSTETLETGLDKSLSTEASLDSLTQKAWEFGRSGEGTQTASVFSKTDLGEVLCIDGSIKGFCPTIKSENQGVPLFA
ncbi:hypothetical protein RDI58_020745 [Solanum bulbocastanum]|uniref:Uncharacterized protein n=1 Tax=Solanum bulbocastanum TaxID=147425 RepID=A0AAN8Y809_SOLBU